MNKLTVAPVPEIEVTLPRTYDQLAIDTNPSVANVVPNVSEIVPITIQFVLSLLTSTATATAPEPDVVLPIAWKVLFAWSI